MSTTYEVLSAEAQVLHPGNGSGMPCPKCIPVRQQELQCTGQLHPLQDHQRPNTGTYSTEEGSHPWQITTSPLLLRRTRASCGRPSSSLARARLVAVQAAHEAVECGQKERLDLAARLAARVVQVVGVDHAHHVRELVRPAPPVVVPGHCAPRALCGSARACALRRTSPTTNTDNLRIAKTMRALGVLQENDMS